MPPKYTRNLQSSGDKSARFTVPGINPRILPLSRFILRGLSKPSPTHFLVHFSRKYHKSLPTLSPSSTKRRSEARMPRKTSKICRLLWNNQASMRNKYSRFRADRQLRSAARADGLCNKFQQNFVRASVSR
jgi:hypothetical protein